jgi:hypothetical protein
VNKGVEAKTFGAVVVTAVLVAMMRKFLVPRESVLPPRDSRQVGEGCSGGYAVPLIELEVRRRKKRKGPPGGRTFNRVKKSFNS